MSHSNLALDAAGRYCRAALIAAAFLFLPVSGFAQQGDSFTGDHFDPVSGYPCLNQFCDVVRVPGTDCLCAKENPSETVLARVRFSCTSRQGQACPVPQRTGN